MIAETIRPFDQRPRISALRLGAVVLIPSLVLIRPCLPEQGIAAAVTRLAGFLLIMTCVLGRLWAILYIGQSKNRRVVTDGPYSITRNPLYFFSTLGALGFGLMFLKLSLAGLLGAVVFLILYLTARREEVFLVAAFGADYAAYAARVPMFIPKPRLFVTKDAVTFSLRALGRNLQDALVFLAAIPLAEAARLIQAHVTVVQACLP